MWINWHSIWISGSIDVRSFSRSLDISPRFAFRGQDRDPERRDGDVPVASECRIKILSSAFKGCLAVTTNNYDRGAGAPVFSLAPMCARLATALVVFLKMGRMPAMAQQTQFIMYK